jgi:hypothetical protein
MRRHWTDENASSVRNWCEKVAALGVDALADAGLLLKSDLEQAARIVAEELFVRLCLEDNPPKPDSLER